MFLPCWRSNVFPRLCQVYTREILHEESLISSLIGSKYNNPNSTQLAGASLSLRLVQALYFCSEVVQELWPYREPSDKSPFSSARSLLCQGLSSRAEPLCAFWMSPRQVPTCATFRCAPSGLSPAFRIKAIPGIRCTRFEQKAISSCKRRKDQRRWFWN